MGKGPHEEGKLVQEREDVVGIVCSAAGAVREAHGKEFVFPPKYNKKVIVY